MEKNFDTDNFEQLLRETTDEFRMYPSKRVWHSIYNDMHPAKKWPSFAILLLLITSITYLGVTNSNEKGSTNNKAIVARSAQINPENRNDPSTAQTQNKPLQSSTSSPVGNELITAGIPSRNRPVQLAEINATVKNTNVIDPQTSISNLSFEVNNHLNPTILNGEADSKETNITEHVDLNKTSIVGSITSLNDMKQNSDIPSISLQPGLKENISISDVTPERVKIINTKSLTPANLRGGIKPSKKAEDKINIEDKKWMDDYVLHNKKPGRKWKNRLSYQIYVTPSVGYRTLKKNTRFDQPAASSLISNPAQLNTRDYSLNHSSALNLEAGSNIILSLSKKFRFKAGLQLNYTNYSITAYELNHPTFTTLMLNNLNNGYPELSARSTTIANSTGLASKYLDNNTYQLSIPIGADFKIAGKNKLKWYAGVAVQPTFIAGGHSYLISSDLKNYVNGNNLMRKFNLNGGLETFVTYKTKNGIILNAGPQFRYQFLSSYSKQYTYDENLYNMGIKIGMTRNF